MRILVTNDDGWDAPGLAALKTLAGATGRGICAGPPGSAFLCRASRDHGLPAGSGGDRPTGIYADRGPRRTACAWRSPRSSLISTGCFAGINRGGNLGADLFTSGTVAAVREAALLGRPGIAVSQYIRKGVTLDWGRSAEMALPVIEQLIAEGCPSKGYWNVNLPHLESGESAGVIRCDPDNEPLDIRFRREGDCFHYSGSYRERRRTLGKRRSVLFRRVDYR